jgi:hypothetical protein
MLARVAPRGRRCPKPWWRRATKLSSKKPNRQSAPAAAPSPCDCRDRAPIASATVTGWNSAPRPQPAAAPASRLERAGAGVRSIAPRAHLSARALRAPGPSHATSHSGAANARQGYSEKPALDLGGWCESTRGGSPHRQSDACGAQASRNRRFAPAWGTARPIAGTDPSVRAPGDTGEIRASGLLRRGWWLRASRRHSPRPKRGTR